MKITAILCNYNGEAYLDECIQSVLAQDRPVDEFIIVDDGSTDRSREIIQTYSSLSNARYIPHEKNQGQGAGFNTAIEAATGELLCFIDSDDVWYPNKVSNVIKVAQSEPAPVLIQHNLAIIAGEVQTKELFLSFMGAGDLWKEWHTGFYSPCFAPTAGLCIRADVAKSVLPIPSSLRHSADSYLTRATIMHGSVANIFSALGGYRRHAENAVHGNETHNSYQFFLREVAPHLHQFYLDQGVPSPVQKYVCGVKLIDQLQDLSIRRLNGFIRRKFTSLNS